MKRLSLLAAIAVLLILPDTALVRAQGTPGTPPELVRSYESLADIILGAKQTEKHLVMSILATTYGHAQAALGKARAAIAQNQNPRSELEA